MNWPLAVKPVFFCDPDEEKLKADIFIDRFLELKPNMKILDFGCKSKHLVYQIKKRTTAELIKGFSFDKNSELDIQDFVFTKEELMFNAPYDLIILNNVIDLLSNEQEVLQTLKEVNSILKNNGRVFIRCCPWCSRYAKIVDNLAFKHFFESSSTIKVIDVKMYEKWFDQVALSTVRSNIEKQNVEDFFLSKEFLSQINNIFGPEIISAMKITFCNYLLKKKDIKLL
jgi:cyclopropane fatty-acyl-phospholipid synthase-like methyltransferase